MLTLMQNIEFNYQKRLTKDTSKIRADTKLLVPADKTTNSYHLDSHSYNQLMHTDCYNEVIQESAKQHRQQNNIRGEKNRRKS